MASGSEDKTIKLWDVQSGQELRTLTGHSSWVEEVAFSPDGRVLASGSIDVLAWGSGDNTIKLWDVASGQELRMLTGHSHYVRQVAFSPDGRVLASGSWDNTINLWDAATGQEIKYDKLPEWYERVWANAVVAPNGKLVRADREGNTIVLRDAATKDDLATLIALNEHDWAVFTPDGYFDGSPNAWRLLRWRVDNDTFKTVPLEAFFKEFYFPGLLPAVLAGGKLPPLTKNFADIDIRQPQVRLTQLGGQSLLEQALGQPAQLASTVNQRSATVTLEITDNAQAPSRAKHPKSSGANDLRLFRNDALVKLWPGDVFNPQSGCQQLPATAPDQPRRARCQATVPLVAGDNHFSAYAFNHDNVKSSDATALVRGADSLQRRGVLYIVAAGVNSYANPEYNLRYAVADAQSFVAEVSQRQQALKHYERVEVVELHDAKATKANFVNALASVARKSQPEDAVLVFFSGHGTADGKRFYLIPHDLGYTGARDNLTADGLQTILAHSLSDRELEQAFQGIDAGQALEAEEKRRGPMNSAGLAQLAWEKGMYILTASESYQQALENSTLQHGYLTYALVNEGLAQARADYEPRDGAVFLREWLNYATGRVPQMQQEGFGKVKPDTPAPPAKRPQKGKNWVRELRYMPGTPTDTIQRPRVFYRRETEGAPLVISRP